MRIVQATLEHLDLLAGEITPGGQLPHKLVDTLPQLAV